MGFQTSLDKNRKPLNRLLEILLDERNNLSIFLIYSVIINILYLAIPLAAQVLINTIAASVLIQPLVIISLSVLVGLLFLGLIRIFQFYITEILQRKIFAKISIDVASKIAKVEQKYFGEIYAPELMNRFFDVITIQKSLTLLLLEVPAAVFQIIAGLILMGIYSPMLLIFDTLLVCSIAIIYFLGQDGVNTSIKESSSKYKVAYWLEELARCHISFKMNGVPDYLVENIDNKILNYLDNRKKHFQVLLRQFSASFFVQAFATSGVLAIGGWLVMHGQLSLGQLVASELIILMILSALDKVVQKLESWYDLLTAIDKVSYMTSLNIEREDGIDVPKSSKGAEIICEDLVFSYQSDRKIFNKLNLKIEPGTRVSLVGVSGSGKTTLAYLIAGLHQIHEGGIFFNGLSTKTLNLNSLRERIALVSDFNEIFAASVEENITLGRKDLEPNALEKVIELVELRRDLNQYPKGLQTQLLSEGRNISLGQRQRILLARSLIVTPELLLLDEAFAGMDEMTKLKIINKIFHKDMPWTIINISHDAEVVARTDYVYLLEKGVIKEHGSIQKLSVNPQSAFSELFPELSRLGLGGINNEIS